MQRREAKLWFAVHGAAADSPIRRARQQRWCIGGISVCIPHPCSNSNSNRLPGLSGRSGLEVHLPLHRQWQGFQFRAARRWNRRCSAPVVVGPIRQGVSPASPMPLLCHGSLAGLPSSRPRLVPSTCSSCPVGREKVPSCPLPPSVSRPPLAEFRLDCGLEQEQEQRGGAVGGGGGEEASLPSLP